ncbi:hypothetical protein HOLleu_22636 [Holothuria leucospilota]|uniref:Ig-like domain-containing protein n=1 Tax=Holothuria leucospilota TaxID=206669 RepID=A0A9Q1H4R6_HOLLE|nr:hypothetical protein HOLleu_22636 [Holothuria leucospilota]
MIKTTKGKALPMKTWLVISVIVASYDALIICPEIERLEEGSDVSINCNISGSDKFDIRWYKGRIPSAEPILELKNVRSEVVEHHKGGAYGITSTGTLTIYNLKREHEGFYFLLVIYENEQIAGRRIDLKVTAMPSPPYPHIASCSTVQDCKIDGDKTNLTCKLNGIRPMVPIKWIIQNTQNANISTLPQIAEHDKDTDTWNVSITLLYKALSCNSTVALQCKAEDDWRLLKHSVASASLRIKKGNCTDEWAILRLLSSLIELSTKHLVVLFFVFSTFLIYVIYVVIGVTIIVPQRAKNAKVKRGLSKGRNNKKSTKQSNSFSPKHEFSCDEEDESDESKEPLINSSPKHQTSSYDKEESEKVCRTKVMAKNFVELMLLMYRFIHGKIVLEALEMPSDSS